MRNLDPTLEDCVKVCLLSKQGGQSGLKLVGMLLMSCDSYGICSSLNSGCSLALLVSLCVKLLSRVQLFVIPWTIAYQPSPSMEFSRQEYWSGLPFLYTALNQGDSCHSQREISAVKDNGISDPQQHVSRYFFPLQ